MNENNVFKYTIIGVIGFWLILFVMMPNLIILITSFLTRGQETPVVFKFTLENYKRILDPLYFQVFVNSLKMAIVTTLMCIALAFPFSYFLSRMQGNKNLLLVFVILPFWTSALVRVYAIKIILTTHGVINTVLLKLHIISEPLNMLYTNGAVTIGLVYTLLPYMILPLYASLEKLDFRYLEAAKDLGAGGFQTLLKIIIPLTMPGIIAGSMLVFLPALGLFYIPDILGGSKVLLLGNTIQNQFLTAQDWPFGSAVSMMLTLIMGILLVANYKSVKSAAQKGVL